MCLLDVKCESLVITHTHLSVCTIIRTIETGCDGPRLVSEVRFSKLCVDLSTCTYREPPMTVRIEAAKPLSVIEDADLHHRLPGHESRRELCLLGQIHSSLSKITIFTIIITLWSLFFFEPCKLSDSTLIYILNNKF